MREAKETFEMSQALWKITVQRQDLIWDPTPEQVLNALMKTVGVAVLLHFLKLSGPLEKLPKTVKRQLPNEEISQILENCSNNVRLFLKYLTCFKVYLHECIKDLCRLHVTVPYSLWITDFWSRSFANKGFILEFDEIPVLSGFNYEIPTADLETLQKKTNFLKKVPLSHVTIWHGNSFHQF